jgi:hypothetical protein
MAKQANNLSPTVRAQQQSDLAPQNIIRVETVVSRFPIHNLSKKNRIKIHIVRKTDQGKFTWSVSPTRDYGEPGQLAYKLDTIVVNHRIDQLGRPLPKVIRLGFLREIARELELRGNDTAAIKRALLQNAGALISAKLQYTDGAGTVRWLTLAGTRYTLVFAGDRLPTGEEAEMAYLVLNDTYWELLNSALQRPHDYDYLKAVAKHNPAALRFYEIISYKIFAAVKNGHREAKFLYSEYCLLAAQRRYHEYQYFKTQMFRLYKPHKDARYLGQVRYEKILDDEGKTDWVMHYTPGEKARADYLAFTQKRTKKKPAALLSGDDTCNFPLVTDPVTSQAIELVSYFYQTFHGVEERQPRATDLQYAVEFITQYGHEKAHYIIDYTHEHAPETNFHPATLGGIKGFATRAIADFDKARERKMNEHAIAACSYCSRSGRISFEEQDRSSFSVECPHDLQRIEVFEHKRGVKRLPPP